ncbi:MAG: hypothetical protein NTW50_02105 [Candidatus Berkelbacteria bacterium]|nr:hypothetical protein [Candidatus Berkelbacteria bacterium]
MYSSAKKMFTRLANVFSPKSAQKRLHLFFLTRKIHTWERNLLELEELLGVLANMQVPIKVQSKSREKIDWRKVRARFKRFLTAEPEGIEKRFFWFLALGILVLGTGLLIYGNVVWGTADMSDIALDTMFGLLAFILLDIWWAFAIERRYGHTMFWVTGIGIYCCIVNSCICTLNPPFSVFQKLILDRKYEVRNEVKLLPWKHRIEIYNTYPSVADKIRVRTKDGVDFLIKYLCTVKVDGFDSNWPTFLANDQGRLNQNPLEIAVNQYAKDVIKREISKRGSAEFERRIIAGVNGDNLIEISAFDYPIYERDLRDGIVLSVLGDIKIDVVKKISGSGDAKIASN